MMWVDVNSLRFNLHFCSHVSTADLKPPIELSSDPHHSVQMVINELPLCRFFTRSCLFFVNSPSPLTLTFPLLPHPLVSRLLIPLIIWSPHLILGLPFGLLPCDFNHVVLFSTESSSCLYTYPYRLHLCDFITLTVSSPLNILFVSCFVNILFSPLLILSGPWIHIIIFLTNTINFGHLCYPDTRFL